MTNIKDSTILITGADGGIGKALVDQCLVLGAKKIYATGLNLQSLTTLFDKNEHIVPVELDVTNPSQIKNCAEYCADTNLLINNAGVELKIPFLAEKSSQAAMLEMKVNYIGLIDMINAFTPHLKQADQAGIVNILSLGALAIVKRLGTYCASKAAAHVLTETVRADLEAESIKVMAAYIGYVNTNMVPEATATEKSSPEFIAKGICDGINKNQSYIFPDQTTIDYIADHPIKTVFYE